MVIHSFHMSVYGSNHTLLAKRLIARSSWFRSLPFWPLKTNKKQVDVSWRKRFSVSETAFSFLQGQQRTAETVFSFRRCTDRKRFSVSDEFGREQVSLDLIYLQQNYVPGYGGKKRGD